MATKSSAEVLAATKDILVQVKRLGLVVQRIHSDRGREFICKGFRALCRDRGIVRTTTTGDDYRANGRVEALVGRAKNAVRTYLSASGMSNDMWGFAMRHYVSRIQHDVVTQLGGRFPRLPPFGAKVFVKQRSWKLKKEEFVEKVVAAYVLCPSMDVAKGFLVKTTEGSYLTTMVAVENVKEVSGSFEVDAPPAHADEPGVRRRMRGKTAIAAAEVAGDSINKLGMSDEEQILKDEELAASFIDKGDYSLAAVEEFLDSVSLGRQDVANRRPGVIADVGHVSVHVLGMFRHGGVVGATTMARSRPKVTHFLVEAMKKHVSSETTFTTISLNFNTSMHCHKDFNNQAGCEAFLVGFGNYVGGALWCHAPTTTSADAVRWHKVAGKWLPGHRHPTYHRVVTFDPLQLHQPLPWHGNRVTMTAYTVGCAANCGAQHRQLLEQLGFPLPPQQVQTSSGGGESGGGESEKTAVFVLSSLGSQEPGDNLKSESCDGVVASGGRRGGGSQEPGENLNSESCDGVVASGAFCRCKGWEVDPSLCVCCPLGSSGAIKVPEQFFIGDEEDEGGVSDEWLQESWGAFGPPSVASLSPLGAEEGVSYEIVASEVPLVGWDLFDSYLDEIRCLLVEEENLERVLAEDQELDGGNFGAVERLKLSRVELELEMEKWKNLREGASEGVCTMKSSEEEEPGDVPLHTKTIPNEVVRREISKWVPSMLSEYESLIRENDAVEPFPEEMLEQWKKEGREFDLVPGKTVHTVKALTGRLKTRAVICGNFLGQSFSKDQKYAAGADGVLTRVILRIVALTAWSLCVLDVRTEDVLDGGRVPQNHLARETGAIRHMVTSPKSWEVYRNKTMAAMRGKVPEGEVMFAPSEVDGSLWYVLVGGRRAGAIICYVDDLLIAGEPAIAKEVALMISRTWKCTEPQWDDVSFNGFEIGRTPEGMILSQDSYTKDLLARYKDLPGYEEVPAPTQLASEDCEIREDENYSDFVKAAQTMAGELQWLAGRCRPEILYAVNLLSQSISKNPKEAVFRGAHLIRYLKRFPEAGIFYATKAQVTPDAQVSSSKVVVEGFCDASFAPNSGRSQQAVMIFVAGGLIGWASHRQAFVTMSTAESELVAICELTTCMKSVEHLVAEVFLHNQAKSEEVMKVIYSDSQAALAV
ncbi:putative mitochondrial protein [Symbiodinium microadriaticum]|uniref:Putative mitochondrial protein n=1 Tax=Symbiodinium microadriaticum TaxID=2951 RepID=A0A1Q9CRY0_SYMMI|nr:putative mitochondrial protein [Symbiodinium microadriaticum]CAE7948229.1 RE1 [Symbiodinium sp. KB8]